MMKKKWMAAAFVVAAGIGALMIANRKTTKADVSNYHNAKLGESVYIFSPEDDMEEVQQIIDDIYAKQERNQFGDARYALCFLPGEYPMLSVPVGYYTQVLGLGRYPSDTKIADVHCDATWLGDDPNNHNALCNFWRSVENIEVTGNTMWAVSQATDMRRMQIDGALYLHDNYGWASGGFLANSNITSMVDSGSQQQWLSRNNTYKTWMGQNWNIVFCGDAEAGLPRGTWPLFSYTKVDGVVGMREKPYLGFGDEGYGIVVPKASNTATGCGWVTEETETWIPLSDCYVAHSEDDTTASINAALAQGKSIVFTPGCYKLEAALEVEAPDTVLLGLGLATLEPTAGNACIESAADGVTIAGLLLDAGEQPSDVLLHVGNPTTESAQDILLADTYFRVGGRDTDAPTAVDTCLVIDADHVYGDNLWVWRADHGDQVGWNVNTANHGVVINGDDVCMVALMVEHFQKEQTVWNGNCGRLVMYQSEVPYDIPSGEALPSIAVSEEVSEFDGKGIGIYLYNRDAAIPMESAMVVPDAPGVVLEHVITVMLGNSHPGIHHVVNEAGNAVVHVGETSQILWYCNKEWK
ncbi:MAG: hypothetical protein K6G04_00045 [Lachnospiraceae bacterium]|nr:hypothetical protein [Lachnospiraceae bacterium]